MSSSFYVLPILGLLGLISGFLFLTLSIASGLYYLSELVEEHTVLTAKILKRLILFVIVVQILLCIVDGFPFYLTLLGIVSHAVYGRNLRTFPMVKLTDPWFLGSCALVGLNHWVWFRWFGEYQQNASFRGGGRRGGGAGDRYSMGYGGASQQPSFTEIASYFGICVWLVPFALFVSLSAGENVLPTTMTGNSGMDFGGGGGTTAGAGAKKGHRRRNTGMAKAAVNGARDWMNETGAVMGLWRAENVRGFD